MSKIIYQTDLDYVDWTEMKITLRQDNFDNGRSSEQLKKSFENRNRDYIAKRSQYQDCGIPEYWIIDPNTQTVLVLELTEGNYTEIGNFSGNEQIVCPQFEELNLTAAQIFALTN